ncbi:MAG: IS30 family transposase, partial [Erysipelotrichaceae bacterium]|nr:IS30 family transposase [Erysipelotrichaceae bacterium]
IKNKSSKQVYMKINQLHKLFGDKFSTIFKSITFDNGSEFSRYKDIEKKTGTKYKRTSVYFAHPYCSYERGSNENCNALVRYFIKKGTYINTLSSDYLKDINIKINEKKRKIHGYKSSSSLFLQELTSIFHTSDINFYL